jgi:hypothetical protein
VVMAVAGTAVAQQPTMEEIVKKWDARRAAVKCVRYEIEEVRTVHKDKLQAFFDMQQKKATSDGKPENYILRTNHSVILNRVTGEFRWDTDGEEWSLTEKKVVKLRGSQLYVDGIHKSVRLPNSGETSVGKEVGRRSDFAETTGNMRSLAFPRWMWPLFMNIGIVPLGTTDSLYPGQWHKYQPADSVDAIRLGNQQNYLLPTNRVGESLLGGSFATPGPTGKIRTFRWVNGGRPTEVLELESNPDLIGWVHKSFNEVGQLFTERKVRIVRTDEAYQVGDDLFHLTPSSGMIVRKQEIQQPAQGPQPEPIGANFIVQPDGSLTPQNGGSESSKQYIRSGIAVACIAIIAVGVLRPVITRMRKPHC